MANTKVTGDVIANGTISTVHLADDAITSDKITGITTAHITEGSNLYYTDGRVRAAISVNGNALSYDSSTGVITSNYEESPTFTGNITFGDSHFIGDDADDNLLIQSSANENIIINSVDDLLLRTGGTTKLIVKNGGNVGIGTTAPSQKLEVSGVIKSISTGTAQLILNGDTNNSGDTGQEDAIIDFLGDGNPGIYGYRINTENWSGQTALHFQEYINGAYTSRLYINKDGNVGIGTTSPSNKLHTVAASAITDESILRLSGGVTGFSGANDADIEHSIIFDACAYSIGSGIVQREAAKIAIEKDGSWNEADIGTGTRASLVFSTNNGTIASPALAERMRIDSSGTVTVTNSGSAVLKLQAGTNSSASLRLINDAHDWDVNCQTNDKFAIYSHTDATERLVILPTSGNVGIGTATPFATPSNNTGLNVDTGGHSSILIGDGVNDGGMIQSSDNSQRIIIGANVYDSPTSSWQRFTADSAALVDVYGEGSSAFISFNVDNGTSGFPTNRMHITNTGKVGIGITSPSTILHIDAGQTSAGNLTNNVAVYIGGGFVNNDLYHREGGLLVISGTNATQTSAGIAFQTRNTGNTNYWKSSILMNRGGELEFYTGGAGTGQGTRRLLIQSDGSLKVPSVHSQTTGIGANVVVLSDGELLRSTSSLKYKTDVRDYDKGLNEVMQLQPKYYKGKNDESETQFAGLIAEDVHDLGLTEFVQYANDGSPDALSYTNMIALLTKGIQELKAEIELLKTQINN